MKSLFLIFITSLLPFVSFGSDIQVWQKPYANSCGYFSNAGVELKMYYTNPGLPLDAAVNLIYGVGSKAQNRDWERREVLPTFRAGLTNNRVALIKVALATRSSPIRYDLFQFVWEIVLPSGQKYYDNGGISTWGFYQAEVRSESYYACSPAVDFTPLDFYKIERH